LQEVLDHGARLSDAATAQIALGKQIVRCALGDLFQCRDAVPIGPVQHPGGELNRRDRCRRDADVERHRGVARELRTGRGIRCGRRDRGLGRRDRRDGEVRVGARAGVEKGVPNFAAAADRTLRRQQSIEHLSLGGRCAHRDAEIASEQEEGIAIDLERSVSGGRHGERGQRESGG
jgi:hypothetical protein